MAALAASSPFDDAAAQHSATIYGRLYPQLAYVSLTGATPPGVATSTLVEPPRDAPAERRAELQSANSRFGLRGQSSLGRGLEVFWQIEQQIGVDSGGDGLASRDTFLGVRGPYGTLRAGLFDTVYKSLGDTMAFLGIGSGNFVSDSDVLSKCGFGTSSACSFHLRRANSLAYESPAWQGLEVQVQYSPDELRTANRDARLVSAGLAWTLDTLYAAVAWELHEDFFGGSRNVRSELSNAADPAARSRDTALRGSLRLGFGRHDVEIEAARLVFRESGAPGRFARHASNRAAIAWRARWSDAWHTQLGVVVAERGNCTLVGGADCSTEGLDAWHVSVGASYRFSRRTHAYLIAARLANGTSARFSNLENGEPPVGADILQVAIGIVTSF